jgi:hypothetical protein
MKVSSGSFNHQKLPLLLPARSLRNKRLKNRKGPHSAAAEGLK